MRCVVRVRPEKCEKNNPLGLRELLLSQDVRMISTEQAQHSRLRVQFQFTTRREQTLQDRISNA